MASNKLLRSLNLFYGEVDQLTDRAEAVFLLCFSLLLIVCVGFGAVRG